jgi:hypothetical protein
MIPNDINFIKDDDTELENVRAMYENCVFDIVIELVNKYMTIYKSNYKLTKTSNNSSLIGRSNNISH